MRSIYRHRYAGAVLPLFEVLLSDPMVNVRRNCAYCVGALCKAGGPAMAPYYLELLKVSACYMCSVMCGNVCYGLSS
jgi:hypothetical protein